MVILRLRDGRTPISQAFPAGPLALHPPVNLADKGMTQLHLSDEGLDANTRGTCNRTPLRRAVRTKTGTTYSRYC
ncbi:unnamed protein product [Tuber melanosporum]|uniref:(Perigord truffle) hypothetical protein n=1 Tax=Tuber melanosporum (strain Mel28) TaxID=656061 RepID=D5GKP5_TUBMM|nr:uncharacterized protein GSTUM_00009682001 [Tuber melanosporum]CAZ85088.1 unnamed protein product [Tuber melanosporum]